MVDTTAQADDVITGPGGFIGTAQPADVIISMSTIDPMALKAIDRRLAAKQIDIIDAPVSGMEKGAPSLEHRRRSSAATQRPWREPGRSSRP